MRRLEIDIFLLIGKKPIIEIERSELVNHLQRVATRSVETAIRIKNAFYGIFRYAHNNGLIKYNPAMEFKGPELTHYLQQWLRCRKHPF